MTALLVVLTIIVLVGVDATRLALARRKMTKAGAIFEPGLGYCMGDGLRKDEDEHEH